ncbi:MAG: RHS repeat-associated core domain-containing protein [Myxococcota bacterium]|nr:RHS repeat-associated core domain-containing protein [Myxococcota bacterium]
MQIGEVGDLRTYQFTYDDRGFLDAVIDPMSRTTSYLNDELGRVLTKTLPDMRQIHFTYDANGNVESITPPGKPTHTFDYTPVDLLEDYDPPDVVGVTPDITHYAYNLDRQIDLITRPDGQTIDYIYDTAGRLGTIALPNSETITYTYSPITGKIETVTSPDGETLTYTFDGRLPESAALTGAVAGTVNQSYNNDFRVTSRDVNGANAVSFIYDDDGLLDYAGDLDLILEPENGLLEGTSIGTIASTNTYTGFGEIDAESYTSSSTPIYEVSYVRDDLGRITDRTEMIDGVTTAYHYEYDPADRLYEVYEDGQLVSRYDYDDNGNRLGHEDYRGGASTVSNGAFDEQDRMTSYGNATDGYASYTYSANGELETKSLNSDNTIYDYDVLGNLRQVALPDGTTISYIIDGENRRVGKVVNGILEKGFLYKDALNPIAELDQNNQVVSRFVYASKFNVPDYMVKGGVTYRIISNHLGSPRLVVNTADGTIAQRIDYDEFGRVLTDTNPGFQPFGFAGGLYDPDTGLVRFGARDYSAEEGRWLSKDPILFISGDTNLFGYVMGDPLNWIDIKGLNGIDVDEGYEEPWWTAPSELGHWPLILGAVAVPVGVIWGVKVGIATAIAGGVLEIWSLVSMSTRADEMQNKIKNINDAYRETDDKAAAQKEIDRLCSE